MCSCINCGIQTEDPVTICSACEILHLGYTPEIARDIVDKARSAFVLYDVHINVYTVEDVHQTMVDLMYGSEEDEDIMACVGHLRQILTEGCKAMFKVIGIDEPECEVVPQ